MPVEIDGSGQFEKHRRESCPEITRENAA